MRPALSLTDAPPRTLLAVYLGDHLAGAVAGVELARRCRRNNASNAVGRALAEIVPEIEEDKATLEDLMEELGVEQPRLKMAAAAVVERVGRLKLNGQVYGYSDLSRVVELEGLDAGIAAKESLWRTLQALDPDAETFHGHDLARLIARAQTQQERVEELRIQAVRTAFRTTVNELHDTP